MKEVFRSKGEVNLMMQENIIMLEKGSKNSLNKEGRKRGRPSTGFDKTAYMKEYMRKKRQTLKKASKA